MGKIQAYNHTKEKRQKASHKPKVHEGVLTKASKRCPTRKDASA